VICGKDNISCYNAGSGSLLWQQQLTESSGKYYLHYSPIIAGNTLVTNWKGGEGVSVFIVI